jgi:hypothetical protein
MLIIVVLYHDVTKHPTQERDTKVEPLLLAVNTNHETVTNWYCSSFL